MKYLKGDGRSIHHISYVNKIRFPIDNIKKGIRYQVTTKEFLKTINHY